MKQQKYIGRTNGYLYNNFKENTQYTLSFNAYSDGTATFVYSFSYYQTNANYVKNYDASTTEKKYTLKSKSGESITKLTASYGQGGYVYIKDVQLEEGSTVTAYEPYYITSSTEVVQNQNHTLTAIWEPTAN